MINHTEEDIKDSEIKQAFELLEKKRLIKLFNDIENNQINHVSTKITPIFTLMKFAVAASVFGLIITTGVVYLKNGKEAELANIVKKENLQSSNELVLLNKRKLNSSSKSIVVLTDNSFGFAQEQRIINITIYEIEKRLDTLNATSKIIEDPIMKKRFERQVDSLSNLINTYSFNNKILTIYLSRKKNVSVVYIKDKYYAVIDKVPYYIIPSSKNIKLKNETNREILDQIERIVL